LHQLSVTAGTKFVSEQEGITKLASPEVVWFKACLPS